MKVQELRVKNPDELKRLLQEKRAELCKVRFGLKSRQIKDTQGQKKLRKEIARILTILNTKQQSNE
jgi:ribosomal protein L29